MLTFDCPPPKRLFDSFPDLPEDTNVPANIDERAMEMLELF